MLRFLSFLTAAPLITSAASAQCISTWSNPCEDNRGSSGQDSSQYGGYDVNQGSDDRGPRVSPYSPNQRRDTYQQQPTLGDPSSTRRTDPRRCTGLLCD